MPFFFETIMEAIKNGTVPPFERDSVMCLRKFEEVINKTMANKDQTIADLRAQLKRVEEERDRLTMIAEEISKQATIEHYNIEDARKSLSVIQKRHALELAAAQARAERAEGALEPIKAVDEYVNRWLPEYDPLPHGKAWTAIREAIRLANEPESVTSEE